MKWTVAVTTKSHVRTYRSERLLRLMKLKKRISRCMYSMNDLSHNSPSLTPRTLPGVVVAIFHIRTHAMWCLIKRLLFWGKSASDSGIEVHDKRTNTQNQDTKIRFSELLREMYREMNCSSCMAKGCGRCWVFEMFSLVSLHCTIFSWSIYHCVDSWLLLRIRVRYELGFRSRYKNAI